MPTLPDIALADALLAIEDLALDELRGITDYFRPPFRVVEAGDSLASLCADTCASQTWHGEGDYNVVTMTLVRAESGDDAHLVISGFYAGLADQQLDFEFYRQERDWVRAPVENTHIVMAPFGPWLWLSTSRDRIVILYALQHSVPPGNYGYNAYDDVALLAYLANLQIEKLGQLGLIAAPIP